MSSTTLLPENSIARWLLIIVLLTGVYFFYGFLIPVLAALIVGFASWPLYSRLVARCGGRTTLAATGALVVVLLLVLTPLTWGLVYAIQEISAGLLWIKETNRTGLPVPDWIKTLPYVGAKIAETWTNVLAQPGGLGESINFVSGENVNTIYKWVVAASGGAFSFLLNVLFFLITLFFIYKDGSVMVGQLDRVGERVLPHRWQRFSRVVPATISSTVTGMTLIAIGEGIILGIAYEIAGMPSAFLLGVITGCLALVPGGAPLAFTSVSIYLVASGNVAAGIGLFIWGSVELFIVDKTLRPKLVGGPIRLPFLPTFFGLIGGVKTMGIVGIFLGPVLMALIVAIWREWVHSVDERLPVKKIDEVRPVHSGANIPL